TSVGTAADQIALLKQATGDNVMLELFKQGDAGFHLTAEQTAPLVLSLSLNTLAVGKYYARVSATGATPAPVRYTLHTRVGSAGNTVLDLSGKQVGRLTGLQAGVDYLLKVDSPNVVPTIYSLQFDLTEPAPVEVPLGTRGDGVRRDVIIGGLGDDVLSGGP